MELLYNELKLNMFDISTADKYDLICIKHRREHGLIVNYIDYIMCQSECQIHDSCPLNPKND